MPSWRRPGLPNPALLVAAAALAVALSGTAFAAGVVAEARHAHRADVAARALDADRVQGRTATQIALAGARAGAQLPGPASSVAGLVTIRTQPVAPIPAGEAATVPVSCQGGGRAVAAGFAADVPGSVVETGAVPTDAGWTLGLRNGDAAAAHGVTLYAVCLR